MPSNDYADGSATVDQSGIPSLAPVNGPDPLTDEQMLAASTANRRPIGGIVNKARPPQPQSTLDTAPYRGQGAMASDASVPDWSPQWSKDLAGSISGVTDYINTTHRALSAAGIQPKLPWYLQNIYGSDQPARGFVAGMASAHSSVGGLMSMFGLGALGDAVTGFDSAIESSNTPENPDWTFKVGHEVPNLTAGVLAGTVGGPVGVAAYFGASGAGTTYNRTSSLGASVASGAVNAAAGAVMQKIPGGGAFVEKVAARLGTSSAESATVAAVKYAFEEGTKKAVQKYGLAGATPAIIAHESAQLVKSGSVMAATNVGNEMIVDQTGAPADVSVGGALHSFAFGAALHVLMTGAHAAGDLVTGGYQRDMARVFDSPPPPAKLTIVGEEAAKAPTVEADAAAPAESGKPAELVTVGGEAKPAESAPAAEPKPGEAAVPAAAGEVSGPGPDGVPALRGETPGDQFRNAISAAAAAHPFGVAVEVKDAAAYNAPGTKLFLSPDGGAGCAVTNDGDLVSVFRHPKSDAKIAPILAEAAKSAKTADCFSIDGFLPNLYSKYGFRPVAQVAFNPDYAPPGWDLTRHGQPPVVFMVKDTVNASGAPEIPPRDQGGHDSIASQVPTVDYETAVKLRDQARMNVDRETIRQTVAGVYGDENAVGTVALLDLGHRTESGITGKSESDLWNRLTIQATNPDGVIDPKALLQVSALHSMFLQPATPLPEDVQKLPGVQKDYRDGAKGLAAIDAVHARHPDPTSSTEAWNSFISDVYRSDQVPVAPENLIRFVQDPTEAAQVLKALTPEQIKARQNGMANGQLFRKAYADGKVTPLDTAKFALWGILSRRLTPYYHESAALDLFSNPEMDRLITDALNGKAPDPSGVNDKGKPTYDLGELIPANTPGRPATGNANDYAKSFLTKLSQRMEDGRTFLQYLHDTMADQTMTGREKRRAILSNLPDGHGIGTKVWSFILLATGHPDVLVLDRVAARLNWGRPEFGDTNIYEGTTGTNGFAKVLDDFQSLAVQEKMEDGVAKFIRDAYSNAGLNPDEATVGAWHWDSWNAESAQGASHGSLDWLLGHVTGNEDLKSNASVMETRNNSREFGATYKPSPSGGSITFGVGDGPKYQFTPPQWSEFIKWMGKNVVPQEWRDRAIKATGTERDLWKTGLFDPAMIPELKNKVWYDLLPQDLRQKLEAEVAARGTPVGGSADGAGGLQSAADGSRSRAAVLGQLGQLEGVKGTFRWLAEAGKGLIQLVKGKADPITGLHEIVHYWEETVFKHRPDLMAKLADETGTTPGTREFSEALANAIQGNALLGKHADALAPVLSKFRSWSKDLYASLLSQGIEVSPAAHDLMRFVSGEKVGLGGIDNLDSTAADIARSINTMVSQGTPFDEAATQATLDHLNLSHINAPGNVAALIGALERNITQPVVDATDGATRTLGQTKMRAISLLGDQAALIDWASANVDQIATLDSKLVALKAIRNALTLKMGELSAQRAADQHSGPGDALDITATWRAIDTVNELTSRIQRGAARTVSAGRIDTGVGASVQDTINALNDGLAEMKRTGEALKASGQDVPNGKLISLLNDPARKPLIDDAANGASKNPDFAPRLIKFITKQAQGPGRKLLDMYLEFRTAALLSGAKTFDANVLGNAINTVFKPWNMVAGGAVRANPAMMKAGLRTYHGLVASLFDFVQLAGTDTPSTIETAVKSFVKDKPVLDATTEVRPGAIPWWMGGSVVRLPFRGLQATDELFKQLNFRAAVRARALGALDKMPDSFLSQMTDEARAAFVQKSIQAAIGPEGQCVLTPEGDIAYPKEMQYAREAAYQQDPGPWGQAAVNFVNAIPVLKAFAPFVRVPSNILSKGVDYTPGLNMVREQYRSRLMSKDPLVRAEATGEMMTGLAVVGSAVGLALSGKTTGGGPMDPKRRKQWIEAGNQPYSFVIDQPDGTKKYISYMRMEPFGPLFGISADAANAWGYFGDGDGEHMADAMLLSVAKNVTDKTYLKGLGDVLKMFDPNQPSFMQSFAASHVPSAIGATNAAWDESARDPKTVLEAIKARLPMLSDTVSPKRDLFGEPVNPPAAWVPFFDTNDRSTVGNLARTLSPIATSTQATDAARLEIAQLNYPFNRPSPGFNGIDLRTFRKGDGQTAYDRLLELTGKVEVGGMTLHQRINDLVKDSTYRSYRTTDGLNDAENPRVLAIKKVLSRYYTAAQNQLMQEFPKIREMAVEAKQLEHTGDRYGSSLLEHLQRSNY